MLIPIIEPVEGGYWEIYPDNRIWHQNNMSFKDFKDVGKKYGVGSGEWLNLETGDNKVRIVSEFQDYGNHFNVSIKKSTICLGKEDCPSCQAGEKARVQFLGWVIDRKDGMLKLLRIGWQINKAIGELAINEDYAFDVIPDYDITIKKTGEGLKTEYTVLPARKSSKLTTEEESEIKKAKDPSEIIESMKAKISSSDSGTLEEEEEVNLKDIPF